MATRWQNRQLDDGGLPARRVLRFSSPDYHLKLSDPDTKAINGVQLAKIGTYHHSAYGEFSITDNTVNQMIKNFNNDTFGQKIFADVAHKPENGAGAEITRIYRDGEWLKGDLELTEYGSESIRKKKYIYLSIDYCDNWKHSERNEDMGAVLFGAGLTIRPFIKGQAGIMLAEPVTPNKEKINMDKYLKLLSAYLDETKTAKQLSQAVLDFFTTEAKKLGDEPTEKQLQALLDSSKAVATAASKQLADMPAGAAPGQSIQLSVSTGEGMSQDAIEKMLAARETKQLADAAAGQKKLTDNKAAFTKLLTDAEGLDDAARKELAEMGDVIDANWSEANIKQLAEKLIASKEREIANRKLGEMGFQFQVQGSPRITVDDSNTIKKLSDTVHKALQQTNAHASETLVLNDKPLNQRFLDMVLADFDRKNAHQLHLESRILSGAETHMGSAFLPASFQREVIREALADLNILQLVKTQTDPSATTTTQIPYEERASSADIPNQGIVYEGEGIPFIGVGLQHELAYVGAMKLALKVTNEIIHFSASSGVNWHAWGENIASNARIMKELIHLRVANEMMRASDTYMAQALAGESFTSTATGLIKTAQFPVVRPKQEQDLKGNNIGNPECPVTITIGGAVVKYWTGRKNLPTATYWRFANSSMGYIQLVDKDGVPTAALSGTIGYSTTGNVVKFDLKLPTGVTKLPEHLNDLLKMVGERKAMMASQRFVKPDYALMSTMLNETASGASQFAVSMKRDGTDTTGAGALEKIKGLPSFESDAPGIDLGDQRMLIGQKNLTGYTIIKPYSVGRPFEAVNSEGEPTGEQVAYGEEYNAIHTPKAVCNRYTSVMVFDSTQR